jgi:hypothetical protein
MAISYLTASYAASNTSATTTAINTTGASLIVIGIGSQITAGSPSVSDSAGNTWTFGVRYTLSGWQSQWVYYCANPIISTGHTFSFSYGTATDMIVAAFSGTATASVLESSNGYSSTALTQVTQPGAITTTQGNEMLITFIYWNNVGAPSISSDFTLISSFSINAAYGAAYKITSSATGSYNPTWSTSAVNSVATSISAFKYNPNYNPVVINTSSTWFTFLF